MKRMFIILSLLLIVTSCLIGCTYNVYPNPTLPQKPLIEPLPITVGAYYSEEFQSYELVHQMPQSAGAYYRIVLGPPSIALFDQIFSEMFEKVVQVSSLAPLPETEIDIKAIIEPTIDSFFTDAVLNRMTPSLTWVKATINYTINLYDLNGVFIANWSVEGLGSVVGSLKYSLISWMVRDAAQIAMRGVATQFMVGFRRNPEAMKWLKSIGISVSY